MTSARGVGRTASLAANAVVVAAVAVTVRRVGARRIVAGLGLAARSRTDYTAEGNRRFGAARPGRYALVGDSQVQAAPIEEMFSDWRRFGINGATIRQVGEYVRHADGCDELVIIAGTNDAIQGIPVTRSVADAGALLDAAHGRPVTFVSVPPLPGVDVRPLNEALAGLATQRGAGWLDIAPVLGDDWSTDGVHFNRAAYAALGSALQRHLAERPPSAHAD